MSQQLKKSGAPLLGVAKSIYYLFVTKYKVQKIELYSGELFENVLLCDNCCSGIVILGRASTKHIEVFQL